MPQIEFLALSALREINEIPDQRHQLLHEDEKNEVPRTFYIVRGGTDVRRVPDIGEDKDTDQLATSYEVINDTDFTSFPKDKSIARNHNRYSQKVEISTQKKRKVELWMDVSHSVWFHVIELIFSKTEQ